jgi:hypothetical protein
MNIADAPRLKGPMALDIQPVPDYLLAHRDALSLERASRYLVGRVRTQTPLGAAEFLDCMRAGAQVSYGKRVSIAMNCMEIYREAFPEEYRRSSAPFFSLQREHELYRLVHAKLFPLVVSEQVDIITLLEKDPKFCLPFIPVRGLQPHCWEGGEFDFWKIELCYRIAQVLSHNTGAGGPGWHALSTAYGLSSAPAPAPPLACVGWDLFVHSCQVDGSPLQYLPLAFNLISYRTGNPWLDIPPIGYMAFEWSTVEVAKLAVQQQNAETMGVAIKTLDRWLEDDPKARITRVVELWNEAARKEEEWGFGGMLVDDLVEAGGLALDNDRVLMAPEARDRLLGYLQEHFLTEGIYEHGV